MTRFSAGLGRAFKTGLQMFVLVELGRSIASVIENATDTALSASAEALREHAAREQEAARARTEAAIKENDRKKQRATEGSAAAPC